MEGQKQKWSEWEGKNGLKEGVVENSSWTFMGAIFGIGFDRQYDLLASREVGFKDGVDTVKGYTVTFDWMREAKIIP